jgi:hypothetical protein
MRPLIWRLAGYGDFDGDRDEDSGKTSRPAMSPGHSLYPLFDPTRDWGPEDWEDRFVLLERRTLLRLARGLRRLVAERPGETAVPIASVLNAEASEQRDTRNVGELMLAFAETVRLPTTQART